ncbi:MAG TPA: hypothetical protein VG099_23215 [Gemmataceae bacterium]|jgi:hypothetical protein|nr:hypothetical protein [Gemmataceae bacterium]
MLLIVPMTCSHYSTLTSGNREMSAIQQAGAAADACVYIIAAYAVARAIDSICRR